MLGRAGLAMAACAVFATVGCTSTPTKSRPDITVTYRFENVRRQGGFDEWTPIQRILAEHSRQEVKPEFARARIVGDAELREIRADVVVSNYATLDRIQDDLDSLAEQTRARERGFWERVNPFGSEPAERPRAEQAVEFSLASAGLRYVSNFVTSTISVTIAGYTQPENVVTLYVDSITPPVVVRADRSGLWRANARVLPEMGFIYGMSEDASRRTRPKHFRINTTTLRHENITREEFEARRPVYVAPKPGAEAPSGAAGR